MGFNSGFKGLIEHTLHSAITLKIGQFPSLGNITAVVSGSQMFHVHE